MIIVEKKTLNTGDITGLFCMEAENAIVMAWSSILWSQVSEKQIDSIQRLKKYGSPPRMYTLT